MVRREFIVADGEAGQRLDHVVRQRFRDVPRRIQASWFSEGRVTLNGASTKKSTLVAVGQVCCVSPETDPLLPLAPGDGECATLWEDEHVVVVNKPPKVASAALAGSDQDSVAAHLLLRYPGMRNVGYSQWDAGLIHRLDTDTSGVIVAAKTRPAFEELRTALRAGQLTKSYLAWTMKAPIPERGEITASLRSDPKHRQRMVVARPNQTGAKPCETSYEVVAREGEFIVIRAHAPLATRHQVRVHLSHVGCPLVSDVLYGGPSTPALSRHALHAERVRFGGGSVCGAFDCRAPIPADLAALTPRFAAI